ncbi:YpiB family protein [Corticicoccus populi]|uniref:YpiB family protein n=1 Tax=Corticicoccus populi TaxID=1812821 RepID=A0ABW5WTV0_9STAP
MKRITYKKDFFNYLLYHYDFNDRAAVWILNFIKSHPVISQNITFNQVDTARKLRIAESGSRRPTLVFEKGGVITTDGEVIFHELNLHQDQMLYIELVLSGVDERYQRVKAEEILEKDAEISARIMHLQNEIDDALSARDESLFLELTKELQQIKSGE